MRLALNQENMKLVMNEMGWNEKKMAQAIGVSRTQVYRVLRRQREPGNEFIAGIVHACGQEKMNELFFLS